jgi:hypothetical protein
MIYELHLHPQLLQRFCRVAVAKFFSLLLCHKDKIVLE